METGVDVSDVLYDRHEGRSEGPRGVRGCRGAESIGERWRRNTRLKEDRRVGKRKRAEKDRCVGTDSCAKYNDGSGEHNE